MLFTELTANEEEILAGGGDTYIFKNIKGIGGDAKSGDVKGKNNKVRNRGGDGVVIIIG